MNALNFVTWILPGEVPLCFENYTTMQKNAILVLFLLLLAHFSFSQKSDSSKRVTHFSGSISVTNNGLSLVPTFSLGEPAALVNLSIAGKKFSFDPDMRFALEGKPWSFRFWARYKLLKTEKFAITLGAHPALNFKTFTSAVDGTETTVARRFLAGELSPNYFFTKKHKYRYLLRLRVWLWPGHTKKQSFCYSQQQFFKY